MRAYAAPGKGYDMQKTMLIDNACPPGLAPSEWARSAALAGAEAVRLPTGIGSVRPDDTAAGTLLPASEVRPPEPVNDAVPVLFTVIIGLCALLAVLLMTLRRGRKLVRRLERERELDAATGLYNLTGLERVFRETVREENRASYYMLCFHFEVWHIERLRGPGAAEDFVRRTAGTLRQKAPEGAVVARGYRDNFFVLCRAEDAGTVRDWALRTIADLKSHGDADIVLSSGDAAVGLFPLSARICGFEQILYHASQCAISAGRSDLDIKVCGGDNCRVCEWERQLLEDFEHGLARGEFQLDLQLIMDTRGFKAVGGEALSRWRHPQKGLLGPDQYVPLLEKEGQIMRLDFYNLDRTCRFLEELSKTRREDVFISCNLSRWTFIRADLVERCQAIMGRYDFPRQSLILEITENGFVRGDEIARMRENIQAVRALGVRVMLDDFGMGNSTFQDLLEFPTDGVKLDKSLVDNVGTERGRIILDGIVRTSHGLGLTVLAEGAEEQWQVDALTALDCDLLQGYFFSMPVPAVEALQRLSRQEL